MSIPLPVSGHRVRRLSVTWSALLLAVGAAWAPASIARAGEGTARGFQLVLEGAESGFAFAVPDAAAPAVFRLVGGFAAGEIASGPAAPIRRGVGRQATESGSTAAWLREQREAKRARIDTPRREGVEAGLAWLEDGYWLQRIRDGWNGFLPTLGGFPSGSGQAFGVVWSENGVGARYPDERTPNRVDLRGAAALSLRGYYLGLFEVGLRRIGGSRVHAAVHVGMQHNANEAFYGFGPDSRLQDRISFAETVGSIGSLVWWRAPWWLYVGGGVGWRETDIGSGEDDFAPPPDFDPGTLPGFADQVDHVNYDAFFQIDWRNEGNPVRGGLYAARWTDWNDREADLFSFTELDLEVQQYFPFLLDKRVVALRARTILTDTTGSREVPFYLMPTLGGNHDLRGFNYSRFRDRNMLLMTAEYRTEIWLAMDLALFVDAGKVVADRDDIDFNDLATNYGIGVRLKTARSTFLRADFAFGGEGFQTAITFDNAFDTTPVFTRLLRTMR